MEKTVTLPPCQVGTFFGMPAMSCGSLPPRRCLSNTITSNTRKYAFRRHPSAATASAAAKAGDATSWFSSAGIHCPKLDVSLFKGLRGIGAREDIVAGEILASVPYASSLVVQPTKSSPFPRFCSRELWASYPWYMKMALLLVFEKQKGSNSLLRHYVADLEAIGIDTPVQWTEQEIDELHYPQLKADIRKQRQAWHQLHDKFAREHPESGVSLHESLWALQAVRSRAFSGPYGGPRLQTRGLLAAILLGAGCWSLQVAHVPIEQVLNAGIAAVMFNIIYDFLLSRRLRWYAMIPAIDYCNHSAEVQSSVNFEVFKEAFTVTTSHHVREGDQVFINYGAYSNDFLLQFYGFIEEGLSDSYVIMLPAKGGVVGTASKVDRLVVSAKGALDTSMAVLQEHRPESPMAALLDLCAQEKRRWPTSLEQDQQELSVLGLQPVNFRRKLALEFRIKKKTTLESCIRHCHAAGSQQHQ